MLNRNSFFYQAAFLAFSNFALQLMGFAFRVLIGRLAGPEGLGVYTLAIQVYAIVMSVCSAGLCVAVTHVSARLFAVADYRGIRKLVRFALFCFILLLSALAIPILSFRGFIAQTLLSESRTESALWIILVCILLTGFENILKSAFLGCRLVRYTAVSEIGEQMLRIGFAWLLLTHLMNGDHGRSAFLIVLAMTFAEVYSVAFLYASFIGRFKTKAAKIKKSSSNIKRDFLKMAIPSALTSVLSNVFSSIAVVIFPARLLLAGYAYNEAVSALGLISGMVTPILMLPYALVGALCALLMPSIAAAASSGNNFELTRKINKGIEAAGLLALPPTAALLPFIPLICAFLFKRTVPPLLALLLALNTVTVYYLVLANSILIGLGLQKKVLLLALAGESLQVALVFVLTAKPSLHVYGYVLGVLLSDLLRVLFSFVFLHRASGTKPHLFNAGLVPLACAVTLYAFIRLCFFQLLSFGFNVVNALLLSFLLCALLYFGLLRLLGVRILAYLRRRVFL